MVIIEEASVLRSLTHRNDADYRLIYLLEDAVQKRIHNIYMARHYHGIPPFFEEIIFDMCDIAVLLWVKRLENIGIMEVDAPKRVRVIEETGDPDLAIEYLREYAPTNYLDEFQRDIRLYLLMNHLNFFEKPFNRFEATFRESRLINPTIIQVW
jgi:hypothetical protein